MDAAIARRIDTSAPNGPICLITTFSAVASPRRQVAMGRSYSAFLLCLSCSLTPLATGTAQTARLDSLDAFVKAQMAQRHIRGLSLAIITDGKISVARAYGVVDDSSKAPATTSTLFQACLLYTSDAADERSSVDLG